MKPDGVKLMVDPTVTPARNPLVALSTAFRRLRPQPAPPATGRLLEDMALVTTKLRISYFINVFLRLKMSYLLSYPLGVQ